MGSTFRSGSRIEWLVTQRFPLVLAAAFALLRVFADTALGDGPEKVRWDHVVMVGPGIGEFVPVGYDASRAPSLELAQEPRPTGKMAADFTVQPVMSHEKETGTDSFFGSGPSEIYTASIDAAPGTNFYGTGEVTGPLLRNNTTVDLWNTDNFNWKRANGERLYQSHPWVLCVAPAPNTGACGVLFDTTWKSRLSCGDHDIKFESQGPPFRIFVIQRSTPAEVLKGLTELTGTMPMPPLWALGFNQCRYSYYPDARVRAIADGFRARKIPCDVIWMDIDYMNGFRIFTFDPTRFPDPAATNGYLHDHGFKSIWMIDPGVKAEKGYAVYDAGSAIDAWVKTKEGADFTGQVWPGQCVFPDFTSLGVRKWWGGLYKDFLAKGVDGVWNDMNEPAVFDGPDHSMPEDNQHAGGAGLAPGIHREYHNVYGMLMAEASRAGIEKAQPDKRAFVLTRANFLGGQRYAATWTGDNGSTWEYLKESIPMSLNLGLSGQPFSGPDIGGYSGVTEPNVYGNWIAVGAFYPFCRAHKAKGEPDSEPWTFGPAVEGAARTALERRYRLLPYLYTVFHEAATTGLPVMRPLFLTDPGDAGLRAEDQVFTLGADFMVIPRWAVMPEMHTNGEWRSIDIIDPKSEADGYQPDIKIREGAIVPMGDIVQSTAGYKFSPLTLVVCPQVGGGYAEGYLYRDAGDGYGYKKGRYTLSHYVAEEVGGEEVVKEVNPGPLAGAELPVNVEIVTGDHQVIKASGFLRKGIHCKLQ